MTVGQIFTKIGNFIENRQTFVLLYCNCAKLSNAYWGFFRGHGVNHFGDVLPSQSLGVALKSERDNNEEENYCFTPETATCED